MFLPDRSIHHALLLVNGILHKAKKSGRNFILLKLDTIKAFDCIDWNFLYRLLERLGFGPSFLNVLKAINAEADASMESLPGLSSWNFSTLGMPTLAPTLPRGRPCTQHASLSGN